MPAGLAQDVLASSSPQDVAVFSWSSSDQGASAFVPREHIRLE